MSCAVKKPYINLEGKPLLAYALQIFDEVSAISQIIITVSPGDEQHCRKAVVECCGIQKPVAIVAGGDRRQDSVRNALGAISGEVDLVMIHDGARPFITTAMITSALDAAVTRRATTMAVPVKDTIAMVAPGSGLLQQTLERRRLYSIQTPQTFERELICEAHHRALSEGFAATDDASLVERLGLPVYVIQGSYDNIKITTQEDLQFASALLKRRNET